MSLVLVGAAAATIMAVGPSAGAGDVIDPTRVTLASDRCAAFGPDFVEMGNGVCGRVASHARIEVHPRAANADLDPWSAGATSSANLRSDGSGMVPGAISSRHLRVRGDLNSYNPFR